MAEGIDLFIIQKQDKFLVRYSTTWGCYMVPCQDHDSKFINDHDNELVMVEFVEKYSPKLKRKVKHHHYYFVLPLDSIDPCWQKDPLFKWMSIDALRADEATMRYNGEMVKVLEEINQRSRIL